MIKSKRPKRMDVSQLARSIVERATGAPLVTQKPLVKAKKGIPTKLPHSPHNEAKKQ